MFQCCVNWLKKVAFPANLKDTMVVLMPKKDTDSLLDLRPIALCNVLYKIIAKVLSNRLCVILPCIISENQSAFVPRQSITDNILVAFEILHQMKQKSRSSESGVALKLNVRKVYNRVNWLFLRHQMQPIGFSSRWNAWIILCVSSVLYSISFDGSQLGP